jgi:glycosyltransferase involved in cell wall biosynthesis
MAPRIFYVSRNYGRPVGGLRVVHHHVRILRRHGFDATVLLTDDQPERFFEFDAPVAMRDQTPTTEEDILVIPEGWRDTLQHPLIAGSPARKLIFCQNHFYMHEALRGAPDYGRFGISRVFCCSEVIAEYLTKIMGFSSCPVVHNAIDTGLFRPRDKKLQIAYMPRKMQREAVFMRGTFNKCYPEFIAIPWVSIEDKAEAEVAQILGESDVFLSLSRMEGLGLPPLEAMAAGALVVGFLGDGGREYGTNQNGVWCAAEDWMAVVNGLATVIGDLKNSGARALRQRAAARATVANYSFDRMERELLSFWREEIVE